MFVIEIDVDGVRIPGRQSLESKRESTVDVPFPKQLGNTNNTAHQHESIRRPRLYHCGTMLGLWTLFLLVGYVIAYDHPLFLVSRISIDPLWCITVDDDNNIVLDVCDFDNSPPNQIWYRRDSEDFSTALGEPGEHCLGFDDENPFVLTSCNYDHDFTRLSTTWWQEYWGDGPKRTDAVQITNYNDGLCMAPEDEIITAGLTQVRMLPCQDEGRFAWHFHFDSCPLVATQPLRMCDGSGCIKAMNPGTQKDANRVELVNHAESDVWLFDSWYDDALCMGNGLLRLESNPSFCLQQGHNGEPRDGTWIRVYPCDCNNPYQQFSCGDPGNTGSVTPFLALTTERQRNLVTLRQNAANSELVYPLWPEYASSDELPLVMMSFRYGTHHFVDYNSPIVISDHRRDSFICLFQQGDGNFRILRSPSVSACHKNAGKLLFHSGFHQEYSGFNNGRFYTLLQGDGNLITRSWWNREWIWKSCSNGEAGRYSLVLHSDDSLSIVDASGRKIWEPANEGCVAPTRDPIVLMATTGLNQLRSGDEVKIYKRSDNSTLFYSLCIHQQGDGNFRVNYSTCASSRTMLFHSGLSKPVLNDLYITTLQRDGNLVTRESKSGQWAWKTGSSQSGEPRDYLLVLNDDQSLAIVDLKSGRSIWDSASNISFFAG